MRPIDLEGDKFLKRFAVNNEDVDEIGRQANRSLCSGM